MTIRLALLVLLATTPALDADHPWPTGVALPPGKPLSKDYRAQFAACDRDKPFRGHATHGCGDDLNAVIALRRLPSGAIADVSKQALDLDGSAFTCGPSHGRMDQCPTSLTLPVGKGGQVPVDADAVPYVVIPAAGLPDVHQVFQRP